MNVTDALDQLRAKSVPGKAAEMAAYHKVARDYLGTASPEIDALTKSWRPGLEIEARLALARDLWDSNIHEARVAAAKLLTQARIKPDDSGAWDLITAWVPTFDAWAIADHAAIAGQKRLVADPSRLDQVETWTTSDHLWTKRAALVMTLPWAKQNHPKPHEIAARQRILSWAGSYVADKEWFIQKSVAWWIRDLSKHDAPRAQAFLDEYGADMKPFARKEAGKYLAKKPPAAP